MGGVSVASGLGVPPLTAGVVVDAGVVGSLGVDWPSVSV